MKPIGPTLSQRITKLENELRGRCCCGPRPIGDPPPDEDEDDDDDEDDE